MNTAVRERFLWILSYFLKVDSQKLTLNYHPVIYQKGHANLSSQCFVSTSLMSSNFLKIHIVDERKKRKEKCKREIFRSRMLKLSELETMEDA